LVRKILWTIFGLWLCGQLLVARADTFALADGTSLTGDIVRFDDNGMMFRLPDDSYTNVLWTKFSQDALKQLSNNPKVQPLVEPFIEPQASDRPAKPEIKIREVTRLDEPPQQSLFGALFSSSVGGVMLLLIYAANLYAGFEVAVCRARPIGLVMGVAAVLPVLGPIIFLSLPVLVEAPSVEELPADMQAFAVAGATETAAAPAQDASGLHLAHVAEGEARAHAQTQVFQRGQFTFNRRFLETKFSGFFGVARRPAEKDMVLTVKSTHGAFVVQRITRIASNEMHVETIIGGKSQEVMVPFAEIQEIKLKHKDA
jgi:hypothetical protein